MTYLSSWVIVKGPLIAMSSIFKITMMDGLSALYSSLQTQLDCVLKMTRTVSYLLSHVLVFTHGESIPN